MKIVSQKGVHPRSTLLLPLRRISFSSEKACRCKKTNECSGSFRDKKRTVHYCRVVGRGSWFIWSLPGWILNRERVAARRSNSNKPTHVWSHARYSIDKLVTKTFILTLLYVDIDWHDTFSMNVLFDAILLYTSFRTTFHRSYLYKVITDICGLFHFKFSYKFILVFIVLSIIG